MEERLSPPLTFPRLDIHTRLGQTEQATGFQPMDELAQHILANIQMGSSQEFEKTLPLALHILSRRESEYLPEASKLAEKIMSQFVALSKLNRKT